MTALPEAGLRPAEPLAQRAYAEIEALIVTGALEPGTLIGQKALAERFGFGLTPVREAMLRLEAYGLVEVVPRSGFRICEADSAQLFLLLEVRRDLERSLARAAARRGQPTERTLLREIGESHLAAARAGDPQAVLRHDREGKELMVRAARNPYLARAIAPIYAMSRRFYFSHAQGVLLNVAEACAAMDFAVADGDVAEAAAASDRLVDVIDKFARASLGIGA
jgi:DNA-binding GntR family transcriptional regulator